MTVYKTMKKSKRMFFVTIFIILITGIVAFFFWRFYPVIRTGKEISALLQPMINAKNQSMDFYMDTNILSEDLELNAQLYLVEQDDTKYLVAKQNGHPMYITDGVLYLKNGKAFRLTDEVQGTTAFAENLSNKQLFAQILAVCERLEITREEEGTKTEYEVSVTGEQAEALLEQLIQTKEADLSAIHQVSLNLTAENKQLEKMVIRISLSSTEDINFYQDEASISSTFGMRQNQVAEISKSQEIEKRTSGNNEEKYITIEFSDFHLLQEGVYEIPSEIALAVATVNKDELFSLTGDLYRLLLAFGELSDQETLKGLVELRANCGMIQFQNAYDLTKLQMTGSDLQNAKEIEEIPQMVAFLCMEGEFDCTKNGTSYVYEMKLEETAMEQLAEAIVPQSVNQVVSFQNGILTIVVDEGEIDRIDIAIKGAIKILFSEINAEIGANFDFLVE